MSVNYVGIKKEVRAKLNHIRDQRKNLIRRVALSDLLYLRLANRARCVVFFPDLCTLFRKDVGSDFKTDSFCVTNFCFLHLFTDLYTQVRKTTFTFSAICAYSGGRVGMLAKATFRINFLR
jgi:hypothetical protein